MCKDDSGKRSQAGDNSYERIHCIVIQVVDAEGHEDRVNAAKNGR